MRDSACGGACGSTSGTVYRVIKDQLGSVRMVVGLDGTIKEKHSYDAFGNELPSPAFVASGWTRIPFGFAGGLYDSATGLYRFGARDYDPVVGRWLSRDATGLAAGPNVYNYCGGDPVNRIDFDGSSWDDVSDYVLTHQSGLQTFADDAAYVAVGAIGIATFGAGAGALVFGEEAAATWATGEATFGAIQSGIIRGGAAA